jgi:predicted dehydrogenase/threonine dehydrogenase-like Zn-dependent dehydrogenase
LRLQPNNGNIASTHNEDGIIFGFAEPPGCSARACKKIIEGFIGMKQLLQNLRDGKTIVADVPCPDARPGTALIRTAASLVSAGTERMVVEFAEKNLLGKARSRPDLVRQVFDKARREGILPTIDAAFNRLDQPMALGYSSAGTVIAVGSGLEGIRIGDRVACAGGNYAVHAEYAVVPRNLLVRLPEQVEFDSAAFTTLGAIALHGFRLAQPQLGERVAIVGMGLLGLLSAGIARAAGCTVFGVDLDPQRIALAQSMGYETVSRAQAEESGKSFTSGQGFDVVLICADARSNDPIELAGQLARDRGRVIAVGAVGLLIPRKIYFEKEIHFQISRSYGPGRYDPAYEEGGQDYPIGFVRWTEGRNLEAFVELLGSGKIDVNPLISHRFPIEEAPRAYDLITGKRKESFLGVLLTYPSDAVEERRTTQVQIPDSKQSPAALDNLSLGVLGAGNYATAVFLPTVNKVGTVHKAVVTSASGLSARHAAAKFGFKIASSSEEEFLSSPEINLVAVLTRHNQHARQVLAALRAGKHVYCEKPLAILAEELNEIVEALERETLPLLMVGFNRRFAPFTRKLQDFLAQTSEPFAAHYRINAGAIPLNHWVHDPGQGGGRIIGEGCHFIDYLTFLAGTSPVSVSAQALPDNGRYRQDNVVITLSFPNGSLGTITYMANGDKSFPKERVEVFCGGRVAVLDDFRRLEMIYNGRRQVLQARLGQDKGHRGSWAAFLEAVRKGGPAPIPYSQLIGVTRTTFAAVESLAENRTVLV